VTAENVNTQAYVTANIPVVNLHKTHVGLQKPPSTSSLHIPAKQHTQYRRHPVTHPHTQDETPSFTPTTTCTGCPRQHAHPQGSSSPEPNTAEETKAHLQQSTHLPKQDLQPSVG